MARFRQHCSNVHMDANAWNGLSQASRLWVLGKLLHVLKNLLRSNCSWLARSPPPTEKDVLHDSMLGIKKEESQFLLTGTDECHATTWAGNQRRILGQTPNSIFLRDSYFFSKESKLISLKKLKTLQKNKPIEKEDEKLIVAICSIAWSLFLLEYPNPNPTGRWQLPSRRSD